MGLSSYFGVTFKFAQYDFLINGLFFGRVTLPTPTPTYMYPPSQWCQTFCNVGAIDTFYQIILSRVLKDWGK